MNEWLRESETLIYREGTELKEARAATACLICGHRFFLAHLVNKDAEDQDRARVRNALKEQRKMLRGLEDAIILHYVKDHDA